MTVAVKNAAFWVLTLCSSEKYRRFGGTYRLHLQAKCYDPEHMVLRD
jgi:hypothetical protein